MKTNVNAIKISGIRNICMSDGRVYIYYGYGDAMNFDVNDDFDFDKLVAECGHKNRKKWLLMHQGEEILVI